jgi:hypothetical protein
MVALHFLRVSLRQKRSQTLVPQMLRLSLARGLFAFREKPDFRKCGPHFGGEENYVAPLKTTISSGRISQLLQRGCVAADRPDLPDP